MHRALALPIRRIRDPFVCYGRHFGGAVHALLTNGIHRSAVQGELVD
jgi:hypothetical protein